MSSLWGLEQLRHLVRIPRLIQTVRYARGTRHGNLGPSGRTPARVTRPRLSEEFVMEMEEAQEFADEMGRDESEVIESVMSDEEAKHRRLVKAIVHKKYFRPPQEMNLLTWDAKEQIRYLHQEYPEEWTIKRLVDSFPISEYGLKLLLKSKFVPKTTEEIIHHDKRVQKHWRQLAAGDIAGQLNAHDVNSVDQRLVNAAGILNLPTANQTYLTDGSKKKEAPAKVGLFESFVKDYCEQKKNKIESKSVSKNKQEHLLKLKEENLMLLATVNSKILEQNPKPTESINSRSKEEIKDESAFKQEPFDFMDPNLRSQTLENGNSMQVRSKKPLTLFEAVRAQANDKYEMSMADTSKVDSVAMDARQLSGTGKLGPTGTGVYESHQDDSYMDENRVRPEEIHSKLQQDRYGDDGPVQRFVYDEKKGYQYPYGKRDPKLTRINTNRRNVHSPELIQRGKEVYDEDGEFLYRTP